MADLRRIIEIVQNDAHNESQLSASISPTFRNGMSLDDAIEAITKGELNHYEFPPLDVFEQEGMLFSLSNRRLYIFRCLSRMGLVGSVQALVHPWRSITVQRCRYDERLGREAPKWERAMSTTNSGTSVSSSIRAPLMGCFAQAG